MPLRFPSQFGTTIDDTTPFIRVPYTDLIPPDPGLERQDSSNHHKALQAFAYQIARETEDPQVIEAVTREPRVWTRAKAAIGRFFLSTGEKLTLDLRKLNSDKVDNIMQVLESVVRGARRPE